MAQHQIVALFPLTGTLLLPGNFLPLNVFEPRYRHLVADAVAGDRRIGMIQPRVPAEDNFGPVPDEREPPRLYDVGCLGRIDRCERQPDGRYHILLRGERRFRVVRELPLHNGYRRVVARLGAAEREGEADIDGPSLLASALAFARHFRLDFDSDLLRSLEPLRLLNVLAAALPFGPPEKQALLEAATPAARQRVLEALMRMAPEDPSLDELARPPVVH